MIKSVELENFKAFKKSGEVDLKKINIFVGPNSSGKSSFIKALLTLKTTMDSNDKELVLDFNESIGNFKNVVFENKVDNKIKFKLNFEENYLNKASDKIVISESILNIINLLAKLNKDEDNSKEMDFKEYLMDFVKKNKINKVKSVEFSIKITKSERVVIDKLEVSYFNSSTSKIEMIRNSYYIYFNDEKINVPNLVKSNKFLFDINESKITNDLSKSELEKIALFEYSMMDIKEHLEKFTKNMRHIESLRNRVKRVEYVTNLKFNNTVGNMGENTITTLVGLEKKYKEDNISIVTDKINKWINEFDLGSKIRIQRLGNENYSLFIKNKNTGIDCNILDMGVGTSQLLPVIIESVNSPENSILIIEEPESHIHPNAQSKLADLFVDTVKTQGKKFIIETHSIFLIVQLQILVAKGEISSDDICIYYFNPSEHGTEVKNMKIADNGQFEDVWPSGFFDVQLQLGKLLFHSL